MGPVYSPTWHGNHKFMPNVGKSSIHGAYGIWFRDGPNGNCWNFGCFPGNLEFWTPTNMCWSHSFMTDKHLKLHGEYNLPMPVMFEEELVMMKLCKKIGSWTTLEQGVKGDTYFQYKYIHPGNFICRPEMGGPGKGSVCPFKNGHFLIWVFPKIGIPQNGWFIMETPIKMDDLGVPLFSETPISILKFHMGVGFFNSLASWGLEHNHCLNK